MQKAHARRDPLLSLLGLSLPWDSWVHLPFQWYFSTILALGWVKYPG